MIFDIDAIEERIGYSFNDKMLLRKCFTHSSYSNEHGGENNEVLEFYGDSIMGFIVTEYLFDKYDNNEGDLTKVRAEIVSKEPLIMSMKSLGLNEYVLLGNGQNKTHTNSEKLFSSVYEALCAGIYLDGGIKKVRKFILDTIIKDFLEKQKKRVKNIEIIKDDKSAFQEYIQKKKLGSIVYETLGKIGPDHSPVFRVGLLLNSTLLAEGKGSSKKLAQADAAKKGLKLLKEQEGKR